MQQVHQLLVIAGLPGSGKTTYLQALMAKGDIDGFSDDYEFGPIKRRNPKERPEDGELIVAITQGKRWAIADTRYCDEHERNKLQAALQQLLPNLKLGFIYFENNPERCVRNATFRKAGELPRHEINLIYYYSPIYTIPSDAKVIKIKAATN